MPGDDAPTFYDKQMDDDATLGPAAAEKKWHGRKPNAYRQELARCSASFDEIVRQHRAAGESKPDPRDPDPSKTGMFILHNCWKCKDGARPCVNGDPSQCEYPHARND